nr:hypothetical protein [Paraburkholderia sp. BCC1885]
MDLTGVTWCSTGRCFGWGLGGTGCGGADDWSAAGVTTGAGVSLMSEAVIVCDSTGFSTILSRAVRTKTSRPRWAARTNPATTAARRAGVSMARSGVALGNAFMGVVVFIG